MLRLYDFLASGNSYKVRLLLAQLGVPFERIELNILKGETQTPEFLSKNLNGQIPVLETGSGQLLAESNAILFYLSTGTQFLSNAAFERAEVLQWLFFEHYTIADIDLFAGTHVADQGGFDLGKFPAIQAWLARVKAQPQYIDITTP